ncbi:4-vinyl reductase [filamentous cyanobacterium LEGE 11480]|uniref:4-vinyl reductase n=1 Tax=Romeriopsis navalis LEGE 11480 TaxID=2777977 RepID=A0A928VLM6_9CYAN|nr:V4R domain-containing protein [Romeriopsis navalis]MBE9029993.1 4-vinyl reductase [Romeriopsis navalis LEGE 11480]
MASVADLLKNKPQLPGNFFAYDAYVQADIELGMMKNRQGARLLALPESLVNVLYSGLEYELGGAAGFVLFQCGYQWGKTFYRRFVTEVSEYYGQPVAEMPTLEFVQCLQQCWQTCGWGRIELSFDHHDQGFLVVTVQNSAFTQGRENNNRPQCEIESGLLSAFFSQLTGQPLHSVQTACESLGAPENWFVLGLADRLKPAEAWLEEGQDHATIMQRLLTQSPSGSVPSSTESPTTTTVS